MSSLRRWWTSRVRVWGRETYIRLFPNPGFRLTWRGREFRWNAYYGWRLGRIR